jgi:hypothetical protein
MVVDPSAAASPGPPGLHPDDRPPGNAPTSAPKFVFFVEKHSARGKFFHTAVAKLAYQAEMKRLNQAFAARRLPRPLT